MEKKQIVLFDLGGVLIQLDFSTFYEQAAILSDERLTPQQFREKLKQGKVEIRRLSGELTTRQYFDELEAIIKPSKPSQPSEYPQIR